MQATKNQTHFIYACLIAGITGLITLSFGWDTIDALTAVGIGALAGFGTNFIAVKYLFSPVKPCTIGPITIQGKFYKRRKEFGEKLVDMACSRFFHKDLFSRLLTSEEVSSALRQRIGASLDNIAERSPGTIAEVAQRITGNPQIIESCSAQLATFIGNEAANRIITHAEDGSLAETLRPFLSGIGNQRLLDLVGSQHAPLRIAEHIVHHASSPQGRQSIVRPIRWAAENLSSSTKSLSEICGPDVSKQLAQVATEYFHDTLLKHTVAFLKRPELRERFISTIQHDIQEEVSKHFASKGFFKRFIAKHFGKSDTDELIARIPQKLNAYFDQAEDLLANQEVRDTISGLLSREIDRLWTRPIGELATLLPPQTIENFTNALLGCLDHIPTRLRLVEQLAQVIESIGSCKVATLLGNQADKQLASHVAAWIQSVGDSPEKREIFRTSMRKVAAQWINEVADRQLPVPHSLPQWGAIRNGLLNVLGEQITTMGPDAAAHLPIRRYLLDTWNQLPNQAIKEQVEQTLESEFSDLIAAGISLGAAAGVITWAAFEFVHYAPFTSISIAVGGFIAFQGKKLFTRRRKPPQQQPTGQDSLPNTPDDSTHHQPLSRAA